MSHGGLSASSQRGRKSQPCLSPPCSDSRFRRDLATLRATFSNFTANTEAEVQALRSQGEPRTEAAWDTGAVGEAALNLEAHQVPLSCRRQNARSDNISESRGGKSEAGGAGR